jgi:hypothetical protein
MIAEAAASPIGHNGGPALDQAPAIAQADQFPNVCFGVAMFTSLALGKIGFGALTEDEGQRLGKALLRVVNAYNISIADERVASVVDLGGLACAIMLPRIMADIAKRKAEHATPLQEATHAREDAAAAA